MRHEKEREREKGERDNRHSRHIKTQRGDTAKQAAAAQTGSRGAQYAAGPHRGADNNWAVVFKGRKVPFFTSAQLDAF